LSPQSGKNCQKQRQQQQTEANGSIPGSENKAHCYPFLFGRSQRSRTLSEGFDSKKSVNLFN
jgi:hypothetical protein